MIIAEICEKFGWTLSEYESQPWWFLEIIKLKMQLEGEFLKQEERKNKKV